jgi:hypothetical protein
MNNCCHLEDEKNIAQRYPWRAPLKIKQPGRMSLGDRRARLEERMNEGEEPGEGGTLEEGKDTSGTEEGRGQTGREGMLPTPPPSPSHCPPSPPPKLKVKNRACGKGKTE